MDDYKRTEYRVSIQLVSPTSGEIQKATTTLGMWGCFHSISFPNEWGGKSSESCQAVGSSVFVSIQLVSPTSGELTKQNDEEYCNPFPFN